MKRQSYIPKIQDDPEIKVHHNLEAAINKLKKRVATAGIFGTLKDRKYNPSPEGRKRSKAKRAAKRQQRQK